MNKFFGKIIAVLFLNLLFAQEAFARGGGGGSGGGGGGGGGFGGGHAGSGGGSADPVTLFFILGIFFVLLIIVIIQVVTQRKNLEKQQNAIIEKYHINWADTRKKIEQIFLTFENAWSKFDLETMKTVVSQDYYKRMVLELNVLKNEKRSNPMSEIRLLDMWLTSDDIGDKNLTVQISASAQDRLIDTETKEILFYDPRSFTEYWHFVKEAEDWKLNLITQSTENPSLVEKDISNFATKNNFYFDADFGWLMMPNKGVLFGSTSFGKSDINNHVIGYYRDKIVEFYTYIPNTQNRVSANYLIAQAILPINYKNILIKKNSLINIPILSLKRMYLESPDFNKKFCLYADPADQVNSLELLTPNFMEKIYNLPFELNIEIVGNILYFYTKDRGSANYDSMLQIISWAFDEMKM